MIKNYFKVFLLLIIILVFTISCSTIEKDCICTDVFATSMVLIIDPTGVPLDSLNITIKDKDGNSLNIKQDFYTLRLGRYTVLNDGYLNQLCGQLIPQKFFFSATDGNKTVSAEYLFNTDDCCCHINKVAGPDTLVLR